MITLKNINKYYNKGKSNEIHVLNEINLSFDDLGLTTILGPSGSGKSTLLHVVGGLDGSKGEISYDGFDILNHHRGAIDTFRNKNIGYVFQNYNLIHELTVYQNLEVQLELIGIRDEEEVKKRIDMCLEAVGMIKYKRRNVTALSGGQMQRVAIARALVKGASILIADEPTGNLDSKNSIEIMNILKSISKSRLVLLVTHNKELADLYSDRIIEIKDGKIINDRNNQSIKGIKRDSLQQALYLDEYTKKTLNDEFNSISIYQKNEEKLNLTIVVEGNTIYIKNDLEVKVIGKDTDKIILPKKPVMGEEEFIESPILFDDFKMEKSIKQSLKRFFTKLRNSFLDFISPSKRMLFVYISFFFIGFFICFCMSLINMGISVDEKEVLSSVDSSSLRVELKEGRYEAFGDYIDASDVEKLMGNESKVVGISENYYCTLTYYLVGGRKISIGDNFFITTPKHYNEEEELNDGEIIISNYIADRLIEATKNYGINSYQDIVGKSINLSIGDSLDSVIIKKVLITDSNLILLSLKNYYETINNHEKDDKEVQFAIYNGEDIIDVNPIDDNKISVYLSRSLYEFENGEFYPYNIVGIFESNEFICLFKDQNDMNKAIRMGSKARLIYPVSMYKNELSLSDWEAIIPSALMDAYPIGSKFDSILGVKLVVKGYFDAVKNKDDSYIYTNEKTAYLCHISSFGDMNSLNVYSTDKAKTIEYFEHLNYPVESAKTFAVNDAKSEKNQMIRDVLIVVLVILISMVAFIFFISRAKMMHQIYNLGVYRALGAKKGRLIYKFLIDSIVLSTCTTAFGYLVMYLLIGNFKNLLPGVYFSISYFFMGLVAIYGFMIIAGILPIILLLRKTPTEILVKYDI